MLSDQGGVGVPIVLVHGLMGAGATWYRHVDWLRGFGHVYTYDAPGHGRPLSDHTTGAMADALAEAVGELTEPMVLIGHSMGGLHAWCYAGAHPDRVRAVVVEDMAADWVGGSSADWMRVMRAWPVPFPDDAAVLDYFGPVAGEYFLRSFTRGADGYHLHGDLEVFQAIAEDWGTRAFWPEWEAVQVPVLLIEAEHTITPPGQMREMAARQRNCRYARIDGAGHLAHDDQPALYRELVSDFLRSLSIGPQG